MAKFDLLGQPFALGARLFGRRGSSTVESVEESSTGEVSGATVPPTQATRPRRSLALIRLLDADCPSCRGFGCAVCYDTGLA
jgi:hypothetical protein